MPSSLSVVGHLAGCIKIQPLVSSRARKIAPWGEQHESWVNGMWQILSRNLGGQAEGKVDSLPFELEQGTQIFQTALKTLTCMSNNDPISVFF